MAEIVCPERTHDTPHTAGEPPAGAGAGGSGCCVSSSGSGSGDGVSFGCGIALGVAVTVIKLGEGVAESAALLRAASIAATISAVASIPISPISSGFGFGLNSSESSISYCQMSRLKQPKALRHQPETI